MQFFILDNGSDQLAGRWRQGTDYNVTPGEATKFHVEYTKVGMAFNAHEAIVGASTITATVAAGMVFASSGATIDGDSTVTLSIASTMLEGRVLDGASTITQSVAAGMVFAGGESIDGAVTIDINSV